ncbi:MAG: hypothetical protein K0S01_96 [Herbinix sp.]|jgi:hypothetical protein|nr:hypothetical protein [Herbinix sp.]
MISLLKVQQNLIAGETYSYPAICILLSEDKKKGTNAKEAQFKIWRQYFKFEILKGEGGKILVTYIYKRLQPKKTDFRNNGNHSIYVSYIELLIADKFSKCDAWKIESTKRNLYKELGMINGMNYEKKAPIKEATNQDVDIFFNRTNQRLASILQSSLKFLKRKGCLSFKEVIFVVQVGEKSNVNRRAFPKEVKAINKIKRALLDEYGMKDERYVYLKFKSKEFYAKLNRIIYDKLGFDWSYKCYELIYLPKQLKTKVSKIEISTIKEALKLSDEDRNTNMYALNTRIMEAINRDAEKKYNNYRLNLEKHIKTVAIGYMPYRGFVLKDNFVKIQKQLADYYLKI